MAHIRKHPVFHNNGCPNPHFLRYSGSHYYSNSHCYSDNHLHYSGIHYYPNSHYYSDNHLHYLGNRCYLDIRLYHSNNQYNLHYLNTHLHYSNIRCYSDIRHYYNSAHMADSCSDNNSFAPVGESFCDIHHNPQLPVCHQFYGHFSNR